MFIQLKYMKHQHVMNNSIIRKSNSIKMLFKNIHLYNTISYKTIRLFPWCSCLVYLTTMLKVVHLNPTQYIYRWQRIKPRISNVYNVQETQKTVSTKIGN